MYICTEQTLHIAVHIGCLKNNNNDNNDNNNDNNNNNNISPHTSFLNIYIT